jgi:hypothetical protein
MALGYGYVLYALAVDDSPVFRVLGDAHGEPGVPAASRAALQVNVLFAGGKLRIPVDVIAALPVSPTFSSGRVATRKVL